MSLKIDEGVKYTMSETLLAIEANKRLLGEINRNKEILTPEAQIQANLQDIETQILDNIKFLENELITLNVPNA